LFKFFLKCYFSYAILPMLVFDAVNLMILLKLEFNYCDAYSILGVIYVQLFTLTDSVDLI